MHIAQMPNGPFYRPHVCEKDGTGQATLPDAIRDRIESFLIARAMLIRTAPSIDYRTYTDFPEGASRNPDDPLAAPQACPTWPHRMASIPLRDAATLTPAAQAAAQLVREWLGELAQRGTEPEVLAAIARRVDAGAAREFTVPLCYTQLHPERGWQQELLPLREGMTEEMARFVATAHNVLVDILGWLDYTLTGPNALQAQVNRLLEGEKRLAEATLALEEQQQRHQRNVAKGKRAKAKATKLMKEARARMAEANRMAELAILAGAPRP